MTSNFSFFVGGGNFLLEVYNESYISNESDSTSVFTEINICGRDTVGRRVAYTSLKKRATTLRLDSVSVHGYMCCIRVHVCVSSTRRRRKRDGDQVRGNEVHSNCERVRRLQRPSCKGSFFVKE